MTRPLRLRLERLRPRRLPVRGRKAREGAAAVEFALVALPFFVLLYSLIELGLVFMIDAVAENAVVDATRLVRTGQAYEEGFDATRFKTAFCDNMSVFKNRCAARTTIDVRVVASFAATDEGEDANGDGVPDNDNYNGGDAEDLVLVRVWYRQPMIVPSLTQAVSKGGPGEIVISSTAAFRNEPWRA
jgi:Flp pilus assembly protein TadG